MANEVKLPVAVTEAVAKGRVVFYGEFRRGTAVEFSGKGNRVFHQSKCSVETETGTITVTEFLADGVDWTKWVAPFQSAYSENTTLGFKVFVPTIILDRNSQICFHKTMLIKGEAKTA